MTGVHHVRRELRSFADTFARSPVLSLLGERGERLGKRRNFLGERSPQTTSERGVRGVYGVRHFRRRSPAKKSLQKAHIHNERSRRTLSRRFGDNIRIL